MTKREHIIEKLRSHAEATGRTIEIGEPNRFQFIFLGTGPRYSQSHSLGVILGPRGGTTLLLDGKKLPSRDRLNIILDIYMR